jgi:hypothetical protein
LARADLQSRLQVLARDILAGDESKLAEFWDWLQFATPSMREGIRSFIEAESTL